MYKYSLNSIQYFKIYNIEYLNNKGIRKQYIHIIEKPNPIDQYLSPLHGMSTFSESKKVLIPSRRANFIYIYLHTIVYLQCVESARNHNIIWRILTQCAQIQKIYRSLIST